jgi:gas vesicle protein
MEQQILEQQLLLLKIMAVFTGIAAVAFVIMAVSLFLAYRSVSALRERAVVFMDRWEPIADTAQKALEDVRQQSSEILTRVRDIAETSQAQLKRVEGIVNDVSDTTKLQLERVDHTMQDTVRRVEETTEALQKTVLIPVRQIRAVAAALSAIVSSLFGKPRPTVDQATLDEEMFI